MSSISLDTTTYKKKSTQVYDLRARLRTLLADFEAFFRNERVPTLLLIMVGSVVCIFFGMSGTMLRGTPFHFYREANYTQAAIGFVLIGLAIVFKTTDATRRAGYAFLYTINIVNLFVAAFSLLDDKFAYQYLVFFIVTTWFYKNKRTFFFSIIINLIGVVGLALLPKTNSTSPEDFFLTYIGATFGLVVITMARLKTEDMLKVSESRYRLLAQNSADIICTHLPGGNFDFVSPSIQVLTGYSAKELIGKSPLQFIHREDTEIFARNILQRVPDAEESQSFSYRFKKKSGGYVWLETVVKTIDDADNGKEVSFLSQTRSFQRHREYIEQIEKSTMELQNSYKDLETFAYISSHDMQEPLRMISNYMQLLTRKYRDKLDSDAIDYIDYAVKGAANLQSLIKDLLAYSTLNKKEISIDEVDMETLLDNVLMGLQVIIQERNVKIEMDKPIPLHGDKNALMLLMQNLIQNGIKYNRSEVPHVIVRCTETHKDVTYMIQDNGIGMDNQYLNKIFEPFQRLHNKYDYPGTGLGLSICLRIVERHKGKIWVDSVVGQGSTFHFTLPKVRQ